MSNNNDIFTMSSIIDTLDDNDLQYILYFFYKSPYLEKLQMILLHSLHHNNQLDQLNKDYIEMRMKHYCRLYIKDNLDRGNYSFSKIIDILNNIYRMNIYSFYLILGVIIIDDQFFDDLVDISLHEDRIKLTGEEEAYIDNERPFSITYPQLYQHLDILFLDRPNRNPDLVNQIRNNFEIHGFDNLINIHTDYAKIINVRKLLLGIYEDNEDSHTFMENVLTDIFTNNTEYYRNNLPFLFRIETYEWTTFENVDDTMGRYYTQNDVILNYFICGILNKLLRISKQFLEIFGHQFCNLQDTDELNGTPLMFACGLALNKPEEPIPPQEPQRINGGNNGQDDDELTEPPTNNLTEPPPTPILQTRSISRVNQSLAEPLTLFGMDDEDDELPTGVPEFRRQNNNINELDTYDEQMRQYQVAMEEYRELMRQYEADMVIYNRDIPDYIKLAEEMLSHGPEICNLEQLNSIGNRYTAYNYAIKHRMNYIVYIIDFYRFPNTEMYDEPINIQLQNEQMIYDILEMENIEAHNLNNYLNEDTNRALFYDGYMYSIISIEALKASIIDGKRYPCNIVSNTIFRPSDNMINRDLPIFHMDKMGSYPMQNKSVLYQDVININTNRSRYYIAEQIPDISYISQVSSILVDSANIIESAISSTHCNPGAGGDIYRLRSANINIIQGGSKIKYRRRLSKKRSSKSKRKLSRRKSSHRKSAKRK